MSEQYCKADTRQRILDLLDWKGVSRRKAAEDTGIEFNRLNRFLSGASDVLGYQDIAALARYFDVSSDFILGLSEDIYFGKETRNFAKADSKVMERLLRNKNFVMATKLIRQYLDESLAQCIVIQNQMLDSMAEYLRCRHSGQIQLAESVQLMKRPTFLLDEEMISRYFMAAVREIKQNNTSVLNETKRRAKEFAEKHVSPEFIEECTEESLETLTDRMCRFITRTMEMSMNHEMRDRKMDQAV